MEQIPLVGMGVLLINQIQLTQENPKALRARSDVDTGRKEKENQDPNTKKVKVERVR